MAMITAVIPVAGQNFQSLVPHVSLHVWGDLRESVYLLPCGRSLEGPVSAVDVES